MHLYMQIKLLFCFFFVSNKQKNNMVEFFSLFSLTNEGGELYNEYNILLKGATATDKCPQFRYSQWKEFIISQQARRCFLSRFLKRLRLIFFATEIAECQLWR